MGGLRVQPAARPAWRSSPARRKCVSASTLASISPKMSLAIYVKISRYEHLSLIASIQILAQQSKLHRSQWSSYESTCRDGILPRSSVGNQFLSDCAVAAIGSTSIFARKVRIGALSVRVVVGDFSARGSDSDWRSYLLGCSSCVGTCMEWMADQFRSASRRQSRLLCVRSTLCAGDKIVASSDCHLCNHFHSPARPRHSGTYPT